MQKGFASILILVGILVITIVAGGVYYFGKSQVSKPQPSNPPVVSQTPQPTITTQPTSIPDETANWKTYINKKYGFSVKYPATWYSNDCGDEDLLLLDPSKTPICETEPYYPIQLNIDNNIKTVEQLKQSWTGGGFKVTEEDSGIASINASRFLVEKVEPAPGPAKMKIIVVPVKIVLFQILLNRLEYEAVANQILSTLKFTQ